MRRRAVSGVPALTGPFAWSADWGGLVFLSGVRGVDAATGAPCDSEQERVERIFVHLAQLLAHSGSVMDLVLSTRVYVTDMARHWPMVNEAFERAFGANLPARTIVNVRALNQADSVEIEAVAVRRNCAAVSKGDMDGSRG